MFVQLEMTAVTTTTALLSSKRVAVTRGRKRGKLNSTADSVAKLTTGTVAVAASGTISVAC